MRLRASTTTARAFRSLKLIFRLSTGIQHTRLESERWIPHIDYILKAVFVHNQDEKLSTLNSHGDKLLQQNHVESQRIADELKLINERRIKVCTVCLDIQVEDSRFNPRSATSGFLQTTFPRIVRSISASSASL